MSQMDRAKQYFRRHSHEEQPLPEDQKQDSNHQNNAENQDKHTNNKQNGNGKNGNGNGNGNENKIKQPQQAGGPPPEVEGENSDNIKVQDNEEKEYKEENDLPSLLKRMESAVNDGKDPQPLVDEWIKEKETKLKKWRRGLKSGAGVQTFSLGLVTFGLGPIPVNMSIMAGLNKHIVHTFTLDDERVDHFVKHTLGYGASSLAKKLGMMVVKNAVVGAGTAGATGVVPLIGPAISAGLTSHKISKTAKETTKNCAELSREICDQAIQNNNFNI